MTQNETIITMIMMKPIGARILATMTPAEVPEEELFVVLCAELVTGIEYVVDVGSDEEESYLQIVPVLM